MKDLYRCLDGYIPELLQALTALWGAAPAGEESQALVAALAEAMLEPQNIERVLATLSPEAREALQDVVRAGGALPGQRLALRYGGVRRLGPARLAREQPWRQPQNALEELLYKGLLFRAYDTIGDYYGEVLFLPPQLLQRLPAWLAEPPTWDFQPVPAPERARQDGPALAEDLCLILVRCRQGQVRLAGPGDPAKMAWPALMELDWGPRLAGKGSGARMSLLWRLLWRLGLVQHVRGSLQPSPKAREWLRLPDGPRHKGLFLAWRQDEGWDELRLLPSVRCEEIGWKNDPVAARRAFLEVLAHCPGETWLSVDALLQLLRRRRPDFLRSEGDFAGWYIRDAQTGAFLRGLEAWEQVEGAWARYVLSGPLRWLGMVAIGYEADERPTAFRLTALGTALLQDRPLKSFPAEPAQIDEDLTITIPLANTLYERYQLERLAEWRETTASQAVYQLTAASVWRSQAAGIKLEQILGFLRRISRDRVPPSAAQTLQAWGEWFRRVALRRATLLQTADEKTLDQLLARPELRELLGARLSPTLCLIAEEHVEALAERLQALGIWPQLSL